MMKVEPLAFPPGLSLEDFPLGRFLPPVSQNSIPAWLKKELAAGSWIFDPIGATPQLALEAARAGYRVLVACNNPVVARMLRIMSRSPRRADLTAALSAMGSLKRGNERMENSIKSLYQTKCGVCGRSIQPQAFIWQRDQPLPYAKAVHCPYCGDDGEYPLTPEDEAQFTHLGPDGMYRSRAVQRVVGNGSVPEAVQEALKTYLPRPLSILSMLTNKLEGRMLPDDERLLDDALLLSLYDEASTLWTYPAARLRPRQLTVPPKFRENNLWLALEKAVETWQTDAPPVPLTIYPNLPPPGGGICLFEGRAKNIFPLPESLRLAALVTVFPRPNQAFWTLSALWSGWLWGAETVEPMKAALLRRRYDWSWHISALSSVLSALSAGNMEIPLYAAAAELVPGFLFSILGAAETAGFHLNGIALDAEAETGFFRWIPHGEKSTPILQRESLRGFFERAVEEYLRERGEPVPYLAVQAAGLCGLIEARAFPHLAQQTLETTENSIQGIIEQVFKNTRFIKRVSAGESGLWWLSNPVSNRSPLADRVEMELVRSLQKKSEVTLLEMEREIYALFPGLETPEEDLIRICLASYAEPDGDQPGMWKLRAEETSANRRADIQQLRAILNRIGAHLEYKVEGENPVIWRDGQGNPVCQFFLMASAIIRKYVESPQTLPPERCILVIPGGRSELLTYKLERDPLLHEGLSRGWRMVKYRQLRKLGERLPGSMADFENQLEQDQPQREPPAQMSLF